MLPLSKLWQKGLLTNNNGKGFFKAFFVIYFILGEFKFMKQPTTKKQLLKKLFFSTLYLSTFTFGGGYVIVSLMKTKFVDELHWIDETEMLDLIAIAQSSPGAVAVNGAIVVGYKLCRIPGVFFSILGAIIPPFFIISIISGFYTLFQENEAVQALLSGMRSGVGAVIVYVVWDMGSGIVKQKKIAPILIMLCAFIANYYLKINIVLIILICIILAAAKAIITERRGSHK